MFRATDGRALVWGQPPKKIVAKYTTGNGKEKTSLLLVSGVHLLAPEACQPVVAQLSSRSRVQGSVFAGIVPALLSRPRILTGLR